MEHRNIPEDQRHEPRGATAAEADTVLMSNGDSTTSFSFITLAKITDIDSLTIPFDRVAGVSPATAQGDSTATSLGVLVSEFNSLLARLRAAGLMEQ